MSQDITRLQDVAKYYSHATKYGDYYLNVTGTRVPDYIIVTSKDELNAVINNDNYRMVIDLSNNS